MKQGDVIFTTNKYDDESIAIYSHTIKDNRIELYVRYLYDSNILWFATDTTYAEVRMAAEEEKIRLYDALCTQFGAVYDKEWTKHFTDSSYCKVLDYLLEVFCIESHEYDDNYHLIIPEFVYEIQNYIWDKMCEFMGGQPNEARFIEVEEESEVKMVSLDKACKVISEMVQKFCPNLIRCEEDLKYWEDEFRKKLEE